MNDIVTARRNAGHAVMASAALGFALGGFFDGILLHQILQWHHLLSGLPQAAADLRFLVMADGLFHLAMYGVVAFGLLWLWRGRTAIAVDGAGRQGLAWAMIGFGSWHIVDAFLSHWLLGIHRIRMDSEIPLFWDILWLCLFGLMPVLLGIWIKRGGRGRGFRSAPLLLAAFTISAGSIQAFPPAANGPVVVLFRSGMAEFDVMAAIEAVDGVLAGSDPTGTLWAIGLPDEASASSLYAHGALFVSGVGLSAGCLDYLRAG